MNFERVMKLKLRDYIVSDSCDITALSEAYNVRIRVFTFDKEQS